MAAPRYVSSFAEIGDDALARVGGKGANLARMSQAGFPVPPGFCVTTEAFREFMVSPRLDELLAGLDTLDVDDPPALREAGATLRGHLLELPIPPAVEAAILEAWSQLGEQHAYAVRSSATAEDLPSASFAGQQDTYLNVIGRARLLERVRACWASLFTDRAISYRAHNGFAHRQVLLSVVVQRMVLPDSAGVLFTADPLDGRRHVISIDASFGLGEALVSGQVNPDHYSVDKRGCEILDRQIADKRMAIVAVPASEGGGTRQIELDEPQRSAQVLDDEQILALARLGVAIEQHFGAPQDIEWCFEKGELLLTQARPITTLFPIPARQAPLAEPEPDPGLRVFISMGHAQVMTDVMAPLAHGVWRRLFPFARDQAGVSQAVCSAAGRMYLDPTDLLRIGPIGERVPEVLKFVDVRTSAAVAEVVGRPEFRRARRRVGPAGILRTALPFVSRVIPRVLWRVCFARTQTIVARTRAELDRRYAAFASACAAAPDTRARLRLCIAELSRLFPQVFVRVVPSLMGGGLAGLLLRKLIGTRADPDDLEALRRGVRGNVTTQMDLELGDLADLAREAPAVVEYLRTSETPSLDALAKIEDAQPLLAGLERYLSEYGMRGAAEIDISRPRWRDDPTLLLQVLRGNLSHERAGSHRAQHEGMIREGDAALARIIAAAPPLRRPLVRRFATAHRNLVAVREHPKFQIIRYFGLLRAALLGWAAELVERGELDTVEDLWMLDLEEVVALLDGRGDVSQLRERVAARRVELRHFARLTPPRVITSEGEIINASLGGEQAPPGALVGIGVSAGVVEGVARVVRDPTSATLHAGEILVAPFTDPGWTPLFINAAGLVMEAGGMMTHGSVVAREYGIPAVVSVDEATTRIRTGQRIVVDGSRGFVSICEQVAE